MAKLLNQHLAQSGVYGYSLTYQRQSMTMDPVMDFLVNVRHGTCERFASALALMLRSQGIPARVIKGFRGVDDLGDGVYQVRNSHAHAWVEALVLSRDDSKLSFDWLLLDPTPDTEARRSVSALSRLWQLQHSGQALWQELIVGYSATQQADLIADLLSTDLWYAVAPWMAGAAVGLTGLWLWRRKRRRRSRTGLPGAAGLYARLVDLLGVHLRMVPRSDETPRELAGRAAEQLSRRPALVELAEVPEQVVDLFYEARYGGDTPTETDLARMRTRLSELEAALA